MADENTETPTGDPTPAPEVAALQAEFDAYKAKSEAEQQKLLNESMERKRKLDGFKDVDPEEYQRLKTEFGGMSGEDAERLKSAMQAAKTDEDRKLLVERGLDGFIEHQLDHRLKSTQTAHEKQVGEFQAALEAEKVARAELSAKLNTKNLETELFGAWNDKLNDSAKADAMAAAKSSAKFEEDGAISWLINGEPVYAEGGKPADAKTWLAKMIEERPHWLKPSHAVRSPGSGAGAAPAENPYQKTGRDASIAQMKLEHENPELAQKLKAQAGR